MALQLGQAFVGGTRRVVTRTGGILLALLFVIQLLTQVSINTAVVRFVPPEATAEMEQVIGLTLPVSGPIAIALFVATLVLSAAYYVVLSRAFARPMRDLSTFPPALYTRRIGRATLSLILGGIAVGISVMIGLMLLLLPGLFLAICFLFFIFAISVEDRGPIGAMKRSWALSRGNRLKLAIIVVLSAAVGGVIGAVGSLVDLAGSPVVSEVVTASISSVLFVLLYAVIAAAYLQVRADGGDGVDGTETSAATGTAVPTEQ